MRRDLPICSAEVIRYYQHADPVDISCSARVNADGRYVEGKCLMALLRNLGLSPTNEECKQCPRK